MAVCLTTDLFVPSTSIRYIAFISVIIILVPLIKPDINGITIVCVRIWNVELVFPKRAISIEYASLSNILSIFFKSVTPLLQVKNGNIFYDKEASLFFPLHKINEFDCIPKTNEAGMKVTSILYIIAY